MREKISNMFDCYNVCGSYIKGAHTSKPVAVHVCNVHTRLVKKLTSVRIEVCGHMIRLLGV